MRKAIIAILLTVLAVQTVSAARAMKGWYTKTQPDGTTVTVELCGDEWDHFYRTPDGQMLVADVDGWLRPVSQSRLAAPVPPTRRLRTPNKRWDPNKIYKSPVVLVSFTDRDFSKRNANEVYNKIFNLTGYNQGNGPGCVADYFRTQSSGLFNPQFDIYGPVQVNYTAKGVGQYGTPAYREALEILSDSLELDFTDYDWDGDGYVEQVIFIYAGFGGNEGVDETDDCIWPSTGSFNTIELGGVKASNYTGSAEMFYHYNSLCGIGTVCHEFSHCLGLPDLYPVPGTKTDFSVVDEYDLMDGGNFVNRGWCPPNYSAHEREYLGWLVPTELDSTTLVTGMQSLTQGGPVYRVVNSGNSHEYYLLENRQWDGWDLFIPNHGLLITHIDFSSSLWTSNHVNSDKTHRRLEFVHASGWNFQDYTQMTGLKRENGHSPYLRYSVYPYITDTLVVRDLNDTTLVAATVFNANEQGEKFMSKPIMNIYEYDDATISFNFFGSNEDAATVSIAEAAVPRQRNAAIYSLTGVRHSRPRRGLNIVVAPDGTTVTKRYVR
jgi:M6 family metalloprotease-like protein